MKKFKKKNAKKTEKGWMEAIFGGEVTFSGGITMTEVAYATGFTFNIYREKSQNWPRGFDYLKKSFDLC